MLATHSYVTDLTTYFIINHISGSIAKNQVRGKTTISVATKTIPIAM